MSSCSGSVHPPVRSGCGGDFASALSRDMNACSRPCERANEHPVHNRWTYASCRAMPAGVPHDVASVAGLNRESVSTANHRPCTSG